MKKFAKCKVGDYLKCLQGNRHVVEGELYKIHRILKLFGDISSIDIINDAGCPEDCYTIRNEEAGNFEVYPSSPQSNTSNQEKQMKKFAKCKKGDFLRCLYDNKYVSKGELYKIHTITEVDGEIVAVHIIDNENNPEDCYLITKYKASNFEVLSDQEKQLKRFSHCKVGDRVKCLDDNGSPYVDTGEYYEIKRIRNGKIEIIDNDKDPNSLYTISQKADRFEPEFPANSSKVSSGGPPIEPDSSEQDEKIAEISYMVVCRVSIPEGDYCKEDIQKILDNWPEKSG